MAGLVRCSCYGDEIHLRLNNVNGIPTQIPITYIFKMLHTPLAFFFFFFFVHYKSKVSLHPRALLHFFLLGKLHQQNDKTKKKKKGGAIMFKSSRSCEMYVLFTHSCYLFSWFDTGLSDVAAVLTALQMYGAGGNNSCEREWRDAEGTNAKWWGNMVDASVWRMLQHGATLRGRWSGLQLIPHPCCVAAERSWGGRLKRKERSL